MTPENEAKKNFLSRYKWGIKALEEIDTEITQLRLKALPSGVNYDGMPHGSGGHTDLSDYAVVLDELLCEYRAKRARLFEDLREISDAIDAVEDLRSQILLRYKYIQDKKWREIAVLMSYSEDYVKSDLHSEALQNFILPTKSHEDF